MLEERKIHKRSSCLKRGPLDFPLKKGRLISPEKKRKNKSEATLKAARQV